MATITFQDKQYEKRPNESVLDCLARQDIMVPHACRVGTCQTCLMRAIRGEPPADAQKGLKDTLRLQGYFLSCQCKPESDLEVSLPDRSVIHRVATEVVGKEKLSSNTLRLRLQCQEDFEYRPGQFLHLYREDNLVRSYSIASLPQYGEPLELHIRKIAGGRLSTWVHEHLQLGDALEVGGPFGECFYVSGKPEQAILLVGTGCGLAPLWGIVRDALDQGHEGPIHLFHGSHEASGLYLVGEMRALEKQYRNFHYTPCISGPDVPSGYASGRNNDVALTAIPKLAGWRVFLCGHPGMVKDMQKKAFLAGAALSEIYADPFVFSRNS